MKSMSSVVLTAFCLAGMPAGAQMTLWSSPQATGAYAAADTGADRYVDIATDGDGTWIVAWQTGDSLGGTIGTEGDILFVRSTDNGDTWSAAAPLNSNAATDSEGDFVPDLSTDGAGNWIAVWGSSSTLDGISGPEPDILLSRSDDNGATWSAPEPLNTNAAFDTAHDHLPKSATNGAGRWVVVWYTLGVDNDLLVTRSSDNGVTWSTPAPLNTNAASDSGHDIDPDIGADGAGNWIAVWGSDDTLGGTIGSDYDVLLSRSTNNGLTWSAPLPLNSNAATDTGDDVEPKVLVNSDGTWQAVWSTSDSLGIGAGPDFEIATAHSTDTGATWSAVTAINHYADTDGSTDIYPHLTHDGAGQWVVAWESSYNLGSIGPDLDILVSRSRDDGVTWSDAAVLNINAGADTGSDAYVTIAADGNARWMATWQSTDTLGGALGSDLDILLTRAMDTDDDLVSDTNEATVYFTDPENPDTDQDLLPDGDELNEHGTTPTNPDTDNDDVLDGIEIDLGTDPLDPFDFPVLPLSVVAAALLTLGLTIVAVTRIRRWDRAPQPRR